MSEIQSREYFAIVPEWIVLADISSNAIRLYALLNRFANSQGRAWPSRKTLADLMRTSTATVDRAKDELVTIGALEIEHRLNPSGDPSSNLYILSTSSPVRKGTPKDEERGTPKDDALNRASMKQSQLGISSTMKSCPLCLNKYRTGYEDIDEEGLSHIWQNDNYIVCPKCHGSGVK